MLWQLLFIILGTTWLWAPHLNTGLSYRTSLISQYETPAQPYSWLFRTADIVSAGLLLLMARTYLSSPRRRLAGWLLFILGVGLLLDPLLSTSCRTIGANCREYISPRFVLHAIETVTTSLAFFVIGVYDAKIRRKLVSIIFVFFQVIYGLLFISQLANHDQFNTLSQFAYQATLIIWLAWFCRDFLVEGNFKTASNEFRIVTVVTAAWAFMNGLLAILISLAHIHLLGRIRGLYFAGDSAWLAQHGVIIGVVMLYLSRHLARGEIRARQIFLAITGIETLKYAVITPNAQLMLLYLITFVTLFIFRDDFNRGLLPLTWRVRIKDLYFMIGALLLAMLVTLLALDSDSRVSLTTARSFDNFFDYVTRSDITAHSHLRSALLAHTISAFLVVSIGSLLWILFKPYKGHRAHGRDYPRVAGILKVHSASSEDFFKLWPADKDYFWQKDGDGFIAYKLTGSIVFGLADPVGKDRIKLLNEFISWAKARRLRVCFLPIYEQSLGMYRRAGLEPIKIGSSAVINIHNFLNETINDKWWRWKKNRAIKSSYVCEHSASPHSKALLQQLKVVSESWLTKAGHHERAFALGYFDDHYLQKCDIHYLKDGSGKIVAFTNQLPAFKSLPTVTADLLRYLPDATDAMPYLLYKTIERISEQSPDYKYFDLGFVPFAKLERPIVAIARTLSAGRFSARGLEQFKNKFNPEWQPNYMAYEGDLADLALIAINLEKVMDLDS